MKLCAFVSHLDDFGSHSEVHINGTEVVIFKDVFSKSGRQTSLSNITVSHQQEIEDIVISNSARFLEDSGEYIDLYTVGCAHFDLTSSDL